MRQPSRALLLRDLHRNRAACSVHRCGDLTRRATGFMQLDDAIGFRPGDRPPHGVAVGTAEHADGVARRHERAEAGGAVALGYGRAGAGHQATASWASSRARSLAVAPSICRRCAARSILAHRSEGMDLRVRHTLARPMDTPASAAKSSTEGHKDMMSVVAAMHEELHTATLIAICIFREWALCFAARGRISLQSATQWTR
jgi:hypothetical protein